MKTEVYIGLWCALVSCSHGLGGVTRVSVTKPQVIKAANFAVTYINENATLREKYGKYGLVSIVWATEQVVSGMLYEMLLELEPMVCSKTAPSPYIDFNDACLVKVWEQDWEKPRYHLVSLQWLFKKANSVANKN